MRITTWMTQQRRIADMQDSQERVETARTRVSTGARLARPSDDPGGSAELLRLRTRIAEGEQRQAGINTATPVLKASESALGSIATTLQSARSAALQAANSATTSPEQREALAAQVDHALQSLLTQANTRIDERYVFAGTNSDAAPFSMGAAVTYSGNDAPLTAGIAEGAALPITVTGETLRNAHDGIDLFANLQSLAQAIRSGDDAAVHASSSRLDEDWNHVVSLRGDMGARIAYVNLAGQRLDDTLSALKQRQSDVRDVDLAAAVVDERAAENVQEATLAVIGQMGRSSLLDYLR